METTNSSSVLENKWEKSQWESEEEGGENKEEYILNMLSMYRPCYLDVKCLPPV